MDESEKFEDEAEPEAGEWAEFGDDGEPIGIEELKSLDLANPTKPFDHSTTLSI